MDISMDDIAKVSDLVLLIRFKLHIHSLLVEHELFDQNGCVVDAIFQQPWHLGFFLV
jgi:hypothetical protein